MNVRQSSPCSEHALMPETPLHGRTALVTGGGVRLGRAIALHLARRGANVGIHFHHSREAARATTAELAAYGVRVTAVEGDFAGAVAGTAQRVLAEAAHALGPIDLLVNNAAIFEPDTLETLSTAAWDRQLGINLEAPLWLTREFARQLPPGREGDVVNILDWRALRPQPGYLSYTVAKAGLAAATKLLALELAPAIRVNAIAPGAILPAAGESPERFERLAEQIPLRRTGRPEEVAAAVEYLAASGFVTGEILFLTRGQHL